MAAVGEYVYARNDAPATEEASSANNNARRPDNRAHTPHETIQMENTHANNVNYGGQTFDTTPSAAILNADQQRNQTASSAVNDNNDKDVADLYAVPVKKTHTQQEAQTPETPPDDETEIEHVENDLYHGTGDDNEVFVDDDDVYVVENDIYDQSSVVL